MKLGIILILRCEMKRVHYMTAQKKRVLDFLSQNAETHFSMEEIAAGLSDEGVCVPKSTLYRQVSGLLADGIVRRFESKEKQCFVYQFVSCDDACDHHFHFKCVDCGRLIHMECPELSAVRHHIEENHDFSIGAGRSVLYGECKQCLKGKESL